MRALLLTHRVPFAPNRGDRIRAYHILRLLAGKVDVHLVSLAHDAEEEARAADMGDLVASVATVRVPRLGNALRGLATLPTRRPLTHALLDSPGLVPAIERAVRDHRPDVVLAYCSGMAKCALAPPLDRLPFVLDMLDVDSEKWAALGRGARPPMRWIYAREARTLARFEAEATGFAFATTVVNEREREALRRLAPGARVEVVPNGVDLEGFRPGGPPATEPRVVFAGVMNYAPNEEGAVWLARDVWPLVLARRPEARLTLLGSDPTRAVRGLERLHPSIEVTGRVPDVRPHLWRAAVAAAPLHTARGVQNKVLEAAAAGLPPVVTPAVAEGLPPEVTGACAVAGAPGPFAAALLDLLGRTPDERRAIAARADLRPLAWSKRLAPFLDLLEGAARSPRTRG